MKSTRKMKHYCIWSRHPQLKMQTVFICFSVIMEDTYVSLSTVYVPLQYLMQTHVTSRENFFSKESDTVPGKGDMSVSCQPNFFPCLRHQIFPFWWHHNKHKVYTTPYNYPGRMTWWFFARQLLHSKYNITSYKVNRQCSFPLLETFQRHWNDPQRVLRSHILITTHALLGNTLHHHIFVTINTSTTVYKQLM